MERRVTITDVAKHAKVSIKTVSRVVRKEANVKPATRQLVEKVIANLNYRPTIAARSSAGGQSYILGLLFDNPNPSYTSDLVTAALIQAHAEGYHLVIEPIDSTREDLAEYIGSFIIQGKLGGIILPPPLCDRDDILKIIEATGRPVARLSPSAESDIGVKIFTDDREACQAMTAHLIELGHKRIGFVRGRDGTTTTRRRLEGYTTALAQAGLKSDPDLIAPGDYKFESGKAAGRKLLTLDSPPTAIFASNDDMAAGVIAAAHEAGLNLPQDLSVAGFDDTIIAQMVWPPLTTVRQPIQDMTRKAVTNLVKAIRKTEDKDESNGEAVIPCELVLRASTTAPK